jgi:ATP phosphoribosyltransferase regulatory subunit
MTVEHNRWLVPDGIEDMLPAQAAKIEHWRRALLDLFHLWGYEQVMPPLVEFVDTLLTGKASDLTLDTCQLVDQVSGRMMGVRSDLTTQVARIDAHRLQSSLPVRLCYAGEVLRARPDQTTASRSPVQVGAELFGHAQVQSDIEVIELMLSACQRLEVPQAVLTLGHVGIFKTLAQVLSLSDEQKRQAHDMLARKSMPDWQAWCAQLPPSRPASLLSALPSLCGDAVVVLQTLNHSWLGVHTDIDQAVMRLGLIAKHLTLTHPKLTMHLDVADLRGFQYHTGVVFGVIAGSQQIMIASGGRYDDISAEVGCCARPATGFSLDLRQLLDLHVKSQPKARKRILAPAIADIQLIQIINQLRQDGHRVIIGFADYDWQTQRDSVEGELVQEQGRWVLR